jgi:hypothetical protein
MLEGVKPVVSNTGVHGNIQTMCGVCLVDLLMSPEVGLPRLSRRLLPAHMAAAMITTKAVCESVGTNWRSQATVDKEYL